MAEADVIHQRLEELADLLVSCRTVFVAAFDDGLLVPHVGSSAEFDLALRLSGPGGEWPDGAVAMPRDLAAKLIRQQADYCAAMGVLIASEEGFDPVNSLLRGAIEYAARAMWLLDPDTEDPDQQDAELGHRRRCARQLLMELVSTYHLRDSLRGLPNAADRAAVAKVHWKALTQAANMRFESAVIANDPSKWSIEGQPYTSWTSVADAWARANGGYVAGDALYKLLAVDGHPQGFSATQGLVSTETGTVRHIPIDELSNRVQLAVVAFYSSLMTLANYHGYESTILTEWESQVDASFPSALR